MSENDADKVLKAVMVTIVNKLEERVEKLEHEIKIDIPLKIGDAMIKFNPFVIAQSHIEERVDTLEKRCNLFNKLDTKSAEVEQGLQKQINELESKYKALDICISAHKDLYENTRKIKELDDKLDSYIDKVSMDYDLIRKLEQKLNFHDSRKVNSDLFMKEVKDTMERFAKLEFTLQELISAYEMEHMVELGLTEQLGDKQDLTVSEYSEAKHKALHQEIEKDLPIETEIPTDYEALANHYLQETVKLQEELQKERKEIIEDLELIYDNGHYKNYQHNTFNALKEWRGRLKQ